MDTDCPAAARRCAAPIGKGITEMLQHGSRREKSHFAILIKKLISMIYFVIDKIKEITKPKLVQTPTTETKVNK